MTKMVLKLAEQLGALQFWFWNTNLLTLLFWAPSKTSLADWWLCDIVNLQKAYATTAFGENRKWPCATAKKGRAKDSPETSANARSTGEELRAGRLVLRLMCRDSAASSGWNGGILEATLLPAALLGMVWIYNVWSIDC